MQGGEIRPENAEWDIITHEATMLSHFMPDDDNAEGLLAFALHRRAVLDWAKAFHASEKRPPTGEDLRQYLLGEATPRRVQEYRARAEQMLGASKTLTPLATPEPAAAKPKTRKSMIWPFGPGLGMVVEQPDQPINWKGLLLRLLFLMLAVIATALVLRFFVVKS